MIIKDLVINRREIKLETPFKTALRTATEIESIEAELILESDLRGRGAAAPTLVITGDSAESISAALTGPIKAAITGMDISEFRTVLQQIQNACIGNPGAKAAADMAVHDAYSKVLKVPLYAFLGGKKSLKTSMTVGVDTPEQMAEAAREKMAVGFRCLKVKVGADARLDIARIEAICRAVPENVSLRLDANQAWKPKQAVQLIRELELKGIPVEFVEQPVAAADFEGLKYVTENVSVPVMADESLFSEKDAMTLVSGRYVDLLNIKLMKCGGISAAWNIASLAETKGVGCMVGSMMESPLSVAAAAHFAAAHPNVIYSDLDAPLWLSEPPQFLTYEEDRIILPTAPGIGPVGEKLASFNQ